MVERLFAVEPEQNQEALESIKRLVSEVERLAPKRMTRLNEAMAGFAQNKVPEVFQVFYVQFTLDAIKKGGEHERKFFREDEYSGRTNVVRLPRNEEAEKRRDLTSALRAAGVPRELWDMTIDDVEERPTIPEFSKAQFAIAAYLKDVQRHLNEGKGIILCGDPGTGKTMFAGLAVRAVFEAGMNALMVRARWMMDHLKPGHDPDYFKELAGVSLLVIDDLGAEYQSEFTHSELDRIITERDASKKPVIITSNYREDKFARNYAPRIIDRLRSNNMTFEFIGESYRKASGFGFERED